MIRRRPEVPLRRVHTSRRPGVVVGVVALLGLATATACGSTGSTATPSGSSPASNEATATTPAPKKLRIHATTPVLAALVAAVTGPDVAAVGTIQAAVPSGPLAGTTIVTPPPIQPGTDLVVAVGLGYDAIGTVDGALTDETGASVAVLTIADKLGPIPALDGSGDDPHVWLDPDRLTQTARRIATLVEQRSGRPAGSLRANVDRLDAQLADADERVQAALLPLTDDQRTVLTDNDGLQYFTTRFGLTDVVVDDPTDPARWAEHPTVSTFFTADPWYAHDDAARAEWAATISAAAGRPIRVLPLVTDQLPGSAALDGSALAQLLKETADTLADGLGTVDP